MCGILVHYKRNGLQQFDIACAINALRSINHRGPDSEGLFLINIDTGDFKCILSENTPVGVPVSNLNEISISNYNVIFAHKRLSIFDTSIAGFQPMVCKKSGNIIVFNGEIYNWFEIKEELIQKGYKFSTLTDTEVILAAFDYWGVDCQTKFNGMWAFVIYDKINKKIFISRDRFAVKPLFYSIYADQVIIASELKQFLFYKKHVGCYNIDLIRYFLDEGLINFNEETFFTNIFNFPNSFGAFFNRDKMKLDFIRYYSLKISDLNIPFSDAVFKFRELLSDAISLRLRADVPIGIAVSGGLDSTSIFALAFNQLKTINKSEQLNSFSVIAKNEDGDESQYIDLFLENYYCIKHKISFLDEFLINDFKTHQSNLNFPTTTPSYYADYCLSRSAAHHSIKVLLNGQGADEVFAGYHHHFYKYAATLIKQLKFINYYKQSTAFIKSKSFSKSQFNNIIKSQIIEWGKHKLGIKVNDIYGAKRNWIYAKDLKEQLLVDLLETTIPNYLASNDSNTMHFGLESRHPFMDYRLVEFGLSLPDSMKINNGYQKRIIREAMYELPDIIRYRKDKMGFTTPEKKVMSILKTSKEINTDVLSNLGLPFKEEFRYYALSIWLENNKI